MKKSEKIEVCKEMIKTMAFAFEKCNIKNVHLFMRTLERLNYKNLESTHKDLVDLFEINFKQFNDAWELVPPATWAFYDMMEYKGLREQNILEDSIFKFREIWYRITDNVKRFKKLKKVSKKTSTENTPSDE